MGKKNKKRESLWSNKKKKGGKSYRRQNYDSINEYSKYVTKKGDIKGKNKKHTKILRDSCAHWFQDPKKRRDREPTLFSTSSGIKVCELCGAEVSPHFYSNKEVKDIVNEARTMTNQMKFMAVSVNASNEDLNFITQTHIQLGRLKKYYKKMRKAASIRYKASGKKGKSRGKNSSEFGAWKSSFN